MQVTLLASFILVITFNARISPTRKRKSTEKGQTGDQNTTPSNKRLKRSKTQDASGQAQNTTESSSASDVNNGITADQIKTLVSS